jgi:hypothetical protein
MNRLFVNLIKNNLSVRKFSLSTKMLTSKNIIKNNRLGSQFGKQDNLFFLKKKKIKTELYETRKNINIYKNNSQVEKQDNLYIL